LPASRRERAAIRIATADTCLANMPRVRVPKQGPGFRHRRLGADRLRTPLAEPLEQDAASHPAQTPLRDAGKTCVIQAREVDSARANRRCQILGRARRPPSRRVEPVCGSAGVSPYQVCCRRSALSHHRRLSPRESGRAGRMAPKRADCHIIVVFRPAKVGVPGERLQNVRTVTSSSSFAPRKTVLSRSERRPAQQPVEKNRLPARSATERAGITGTCWSV